MFEFEIKSPVGKISTKFLHRYQVRYLRVRGKIVIEIMNHDLLKAKSLFPVLKSKISDKAKEAVGQKIECMDGNFEVHHCCLVNSDILWDFFEGTIQNYQFMISLCNIIYVWHKPYDRG